MMNRHDRLLTSTADSRGFEQSHHAQPKPAQSRPAQSDPIVIQSRADGEGSRRRRPQPQRAGRRILRSFTALRMTVGVVVVMLLVTASAHAQLGGLLDKLEKNKDKITKGAKVVQSASREFTEAEEADIGRVVAARILQTYPLAKNDRLQQYVTLVGNTVAGYSARPTLEWHFAVLETDIVNAFSCPGGFIFVTTGALEQMHSEAELAAVLGHEIAHATQKHILKEVKRANTVSAAQDLATTASSGSFLTDALGEKISNLAYEKLFTTGLSRRDEQEADKIGVEMAEAAGYRASEFLRFLDALHALEGESEMRVLTATHPAAAERKKQVKPIAGGDSGEVLAERWAAWTQLAPATARK